MLTHMQLRARVENELGFRLNLRLYETVTSATVKDDVIVVLTEIFKVRELHRETRYIGRGQRVTEYRAHTFDAIGDNPPNKVWYKNQTLLVWDDDFAPVTLATLRKVQSPAEWNDQRTYEANCHRPGTSNFPMDNYDRAVLFPDSTDNKKMARHWRAVERTVGAGEA